MLHCHSSHWVFVQDISLTLVVVERLFTHEWSHWRSSDFSSMIKGSWSGVRICSFYNHEHRAACRLVEWSDSAQHIHWGSSKVIREAIMSTVAEKVRLALQIDTLKFETKEMIDRLEDLKKCMKEGDGDGVAFFLSSLTTELVTWYNHMWVCCSNFTSSCKQK